MPPEPLRTRVNLWLQERSPLEALQGLLKRKVVPMHRQSVWYCLGGLLLFNLGVLICTGMLLAVHYEVGVSSAPDMPGSHGSVELIVNELPNGWWIRSIHHWTANVMIMAAFLHLFSILLMKAYRRPRELVWWTGLGAYCLVLTSAFTGYLLPWNTLSFSATRVGAGIAGALPLAGPVIRDLLLAGPDVSGATLTRFFAIHVAVLPIAIVSMVGMHLVLLLHHGSSVPASAKVCKEPGGRLWSMRFWPEYVLHDARVWLLALTGVLTVAFLLPPPVGEQADPLAPAPEGIRPEWYFLSLFRAFKLMPDHVLGMENLTAGVVSMATVGTIMLLIPILHPRPSLKLRPGRTVVIRRRLLLLVSALLGWAAVTPPLKMAAGHLCHDWLGTPGAFAAGVVTAIAALGWLAVAVAVDRAREQNPDGPATLFGITLVSVVAGYTLWEALGAEVALAVLVVLHSVLAFAWATRRRAGWVIRTVKTSTILLLVGILILVVPLGISHQLSGDGAHELGQRVAEAVPVVPPERRDQSLGRFVFALAICAFLIVIVELRILLTRRNREMGLPE